MAEHAVNQPWWDEVEAAYFEHWPSRALARVREAQLIRACDPAYNYPPRSKNHFERIDEWARTNLQWVNDEDESDLAPYDGEDLLEDWWSGRIVDLSGIGKIAHSLRVYIGDYKGDRLPDWYERGEPTGRPALW